MTAPPETIHCQGCGADSGDPHEWRKCADLGSKRTVVEGKPGHWYQRTDKDGTQFACSRACIDIIAAATGKTRVILPW